MFTARSNARALCIRQGFHLIKVRRCLIFHRPHFSLTEFLNQCNSRTTQYRWFPTLKLLNIFGSQLSNYPISLDPTVQLPHVVESNYQTTQYLRIQLSNHPISLGPHSQTTQYIWIPTLKLPIIVGSTSQTTQYLRIQLSNSPMSLDPNSQTN